MGKKKGKKSKQDARGYSTSVIQGAPPPPVTAAQTSTNVQSLLKKGSPSCALVSTPSSKENEPVTVIAPALSDATSKRFFKKIETLYDQLIRCKFTEEQIDTVLQALVVSSSNSFTTSDTDLFALEAALDWFCLNLPPEELPALFTEQEVREAAVQTGTEVEIMKLESLVYTGDNPVQFDASVDQHLLVDNAAQIEDDESKQAEAIEKEEAQKAWILNQYQFEDPEEPQSGTATETLLEDVQQIISEEAEAAPLSPEELRLIKLEKEVDEMRASLNDEASNYMRSKHEIKDLKKQFSMLQGQAKKLRGKVSKIQVASESTAREVEQQPMPSGIDTSNNDEERYIITADEEESDLGVTLGMFDEPGESDVFPMLVEPAAKESTGVVEEIKETMDDPFRLSSTEESIPKGWTGTTPKKQLEDWCKKQKLPRPTFTKLPRSRSGCRVKVKSKPLERTFEQEGPFHDFTDAQQYVATEALYSIMPDLPMYRMFPPVFRDLWKGWISLINESKSLQKREDRDLKEGRIRKLIELIPKQLQIRDTEDLATTQFAIDTSNNPMADIDWEDKAQSNEAEVAETETKLGQDLRDEFVRLRGTSQYKAMEEIRKGLPMHKYKDILLDCVTNNAVTVLCAETGAGKTTQGPQFMLEEALDAGVGDKSSIICTQPRRISAMSVAERVADEMCVRLGDLVGYQIRGEVVKSQRTKLLFCTTGVVLRRLQEDPSLTGITTVVVDEVHERSWQIDFLLIALRRLLQTTRPDLKVVLMSATLDSELFCSFFGGAPLVNVPGRTYPVATYFLEDLYDATNHTIEEDSMYTLRELRKRGSTESLWVSKQGGDKRREVVELDSQTDVSQVSGFYPGYQINTQRSMDRVDEKVLNHDLIEDVLLLLTSSENDSIMTPSGMNPCINSDGAFLIFLPGMAEIRSMTNRLTASRFFGSKNKFEVIPLHSSLSPQEQKRAFAKPRAGCRKIIISTNVAETSITIPDVVCVIDTGLVREVRQDKRYATSKLVLDWTSKASIKQRAGRAGRVQEGICCRLFSSRTAKLFMKDQTTPELQRVPLEEVCLSILAGNLSHSCTDFLMQAPQPPPLDSISLALRLLTEVGAVQIAANGQESLSALGLHVAKIPVHVRLAKMLIFGAVFKCLDPVLTIVASLSGKSPFATVMNDATRAAAAHQKFRHESSDFLGFVQLWEVFVKEVENSRDQGRVFCRRNFINWTVMMDIRDLRRQNLELLLQIGFVRGKLRENELHKNPMFNRNGSNETVVHAVVCAGLYPNIAKAVKGHTDDPPELWHQKERLFFHSSSVNHGKKKLLSDWIVFHEKFATGRTTISATSPVHPLTLILFGGDVVVKHVDRKVLVDDWISLDIAAQTGVQFRELRRKLDVFLISLIEKADSSNADEMVDGVVKLISN